MQYLEYDIHIWRRKKDIQYRHKVTGTAVFVITFYATFNLLWSSLYTTDKEVKRRYIFFSFKKDITTRGNELTLVKDKCILDISKYSFSQRTNNLQIA